jgi:SAM-dependent methyltransferase
VFTKTARFYDVIYSWKDYTREAERLHELIHAHGGRAGDALLDVACGTGMHLTHLKRYYAVEGLDLDAELLAIARERNPDVVFHQDDMVTFDLGRQFGVILCLFSSIGYVKTEERLRETIANFARHTRPGGVVIVEPWLMPDVYRPGGIHALFVDQADLKIARMNNSGLEDGVSVLHMEYLVGTPEGITHFTERHELGLFTHEQYLEAFRAARLEVSHDAAGLMGRGLYVGRRSGA